MATVAILSPPPIPVGAAAAVEQVQSTMADLKGQMDSHVAKLDGILDQLTNVASQVDTAQFAEPDLDFEVVTPTLESTTGPADLTLSNTIDTDAPSAPGTAPSIPAQPDFVMPPEPGMDVISIPAAPVLVVGTAPARPVVDTNITVPDAPVINLPTMEALTDIQVPNFVAPTLPEFNEAAPTFDAVAPDVNIDWVEPVYESENFDELLATMREWRAGRSGLPPEVENALFERNRGREDRAADKAVAELYDAYGARGFLEPPGVLLKQVQAVRETSQLAVSSFSRDVFIKATDTQMENLRLSVTQGLAAEQVLLSIFNNAAQRSFEMARFVVESLITLYNTKVSIFNTLTQAYATRAQVFKIRIDAALAALEVYRLELEGEKLKGEINQQRVQVFQALMTAALSQIEIYKAQLMGVGQKVEIIKALFDAYKTDVQAFAETIGAEKIKFDAYKVQVDGQASIANINETRGRIFQSLVGAQETIARTWAQGAQVEIGRFSATASMFGSTINSFQAKTQAQLGRVQAVVSLKNAATSAGEARDRAVIAANEAALRIGQQKLDSNIQKAQLGVKLYEVNITRLNQRQQIQEQALAAAGQMVSTLAGGAMAAQHVTASITSSASDGYSVGQTTSISNTLSEKV